MYYGDIRLGKTIEWTFTTRRFTTGVPFTLAGTPSLEAYETGNTTPITAGITLTVDYSGVTGLNHVSLVASGANGFATQNDISVVIAAGTVDSVSVVGETIGAFSIENRSAVMPTTADRTLDVTATGAAGIDWGNVENPSTANNLSATNIDPDQVVASVTGAVGSVTGAVGSVTGNVGGNVNGNVVGTVASVVGDVGGNVVGDVQGNLDGDIGGMSLAALADFFLIDSGETYASAVAGSVVKETADNATIAGTVDANLVSIQSDAQSATDLKDFADAGYDPATNKVQGLVLADAVTVVNGLAANVITATSIAADAITAAKVADGTIDAATFAAGAINAAAIANGAIDAATFAANAIDAAALAADAVTEIQAGLATAAALATVQADTDNIQTRLPAALVGGRIDSSVGAMAANVLTAAATAADYITEVQAAILSDATPFAGANINATISSRATPAQVNAEVVDALATDTYAEPTGVPGNTVSLAEKIGRNYQALVKGIEVDSNTGKIGFRNAAGTIIWEKDVTDVLGVYNESAGNAP